jgi:ribosomal protein S18 acetylase RimI-like enzyme
LVFVVAPEHRGQVIGGRCLCAIAEQLARDGVREVFGGVEPDNEAS